MKITFNYGLKFSRSKYFAVLFPLSSIRFSALLNFSFESTASTFIVSASILYLVRTKCISAIYFIISMTSTEKNISKLHTRHADHKYKTISN